MKLWKKSVMMLVIGTFLLSMALPMASPLPTRTNATVTEDERASALLDTKDGEEGSETSDDVSDEEESESNAEDEEEDGLEEEDEQDEDGDEIDDGYEDENGRELSIEFDDDEIQIESELKSNTSKDEISFKVETGGELAVKLEYKSEIDTAEAEQEYEISFKVVFKNLVEFVDLDGDSTYNESVDQKIQEVQLDSFAPIVYDPQIQADNSTLHYFKAATTDGVFSAHMFIGGEFFDLQTTVLAPTELKIDIEIANFSYAHNASQLALYTKIESEAELEHEETTEDEAYGFATNESALQADFNGFMAGFSWAEQAEIDGVMQNITISPFESDDSSPNDDKFYINYPRGETIYHDPKIGVVGILESPSAQSDNTFLGSIPGYSGVLIALAGIGMLGLLMASNQKRRK